MAEGEVHREEVREGGLGRHFESRRDGIGGVLPELRLWQLADNVVRGADQLARRVFVEKQRRLRHAEVHWPVNRLVQIFVERLITLLGERSIVVLADGGNHKE